MGYYIILRKDPTFREILQTLLLAVKLSRLIDNMTA